ncbi:cytochrome c oxidase assembly protein [Rhodococcus aerolatus]
MPPLTGVALLTSWTPQPAVTVPAALLAVAYLVAVRKTGAVDRRAVVSFLAGCGVLALVGASVLGVYQDTLFWVRALQNVLLLLVVPLLLALGRPVTVVLAAAPPVVAARLRAAGRSAWARRLTFPAVVTVLLVGPLPVLYLTAAYPATLDSPVADAAARVLLVGCGFVYFWTRLQVDPVPRPGSHLGSFAISLVEQVVDGVLGLVVWLGPLIAAAHYAGVARGWGPDLRTDQVIGAGVLWIGGDVAGLPFLGVLFLRWVHDDERAARRADRELDEAVPAPAAAGEAAAPALWWEADPEIAARFRRR